MATVHLCMSLPSISVLRVVASLKSSCRASV